MPVSMKNKSLTVELFYNNLLNLDLIPNQILATNCEESEEKMKCMNGYQQQNSAWSM